MSEKSGGSRGDDGGSRSARKSPARGAGGRDRVTADGAVRGAGGRVTADGAAPAPAGRDRVTADGAARGVGDRVTADGAARGAGGREVVAADDVERGTPSRGAVLVADLRADLTSAIDGAPRWLTGAGAGLQAVLLSLVAVVVPVLAAYVAGSTEASGADAGWLQAAALGVDVWLLAHGVPVGTSAATITIVPLGLSALAVFCAYASARRSGTPTRTGLAASWVAYVLAVVAVAALAQLGGVDGGPSVARVLLTAAAGGVVVGGIGLGAGLAVRPDTPRLTVALAPLRERLPRPVWLGAGAGLALAAVLGGLGGIVLLTWVLGGQTQVADIVASLQLDALGGVTLALTQLAIVPNLAAWALAWLAGPGFAVGTGSHFATSGVHDAVLPAIPALGVLPTAESVPPTTAFWPLVIFALAAAVGVVLHRRLGDVGPGAAAASVAAAVVVTATAVAFVVEAAGGSAGPGRMAQVGASGLVTGLVAAVPVGLGLLAVVVVGNARVVGRARTLAARGLAAGRRRLGR